MSTAVLFLLLTCAFLTLKVNIWVFFVFVQQRQLADDEIDGELNSLHSLVFFICFPDYLHVQPLLQRAQQLFNKLFQTFCMCNGRNVFEQLWH